MEFNFTKHTLDFIKPGGTSRGVLKSKDSWIIFAKANNELIGIGECSIINGLSPDPVKKIEHKIEKLLDKWRSKGFDNDDFPVDLKGFPALRFGIESIRLGIANRDPFKIVQSPFLQGGSGIPINGLVWMGTRKYMLSQIKEKIESGFRCIKIKIGAIDFEEECALLAYIRNEFSPEDIEIRVDANGAFSPADALEKLYRLYTYKVHSIEQPVQAGQWVKMGQLCDESPIDIALDEELIGLEDEAARKTMLEAIRPQYIILKPSLLGGLRASDEWIELAESMQIGWWVTSALESNIGLNAIAQWVGNLNNLRPQGLGTGQLFSNNITSPLEIERGSLCYNISRNWELPEHWLQD